MAAIRGLDVLKETNGRVGGAHQIRDNLVGRLYHRDAHQRAIAAQVLNSLATSGPENRILDAFGLRVDRSGSGRIVPVKIRLSPDRRRILIGFLFPP